MAMKTERLFAELLGNVEVRKVDFKRDQYLLSNDVLKSEFVKDVLCMANASGDDGYILLGVKTDKGKPREVVGISAHHDSADLEAIVNGVIEEPIQFEYYPVVFKGKKCAFLHVPASKARPHWPRRDYGVLSKHVFYTRRASGNREASIQEIRDMCIGTIRVSDIALRRARLSPHVIDEFVDMSMDERREAMRKILKSIAPKVGFVRYHELWGVYSRAPFCTLARNADRNAVRDYALFVYPWEAKKWDIIAARRNAESFTVTKGLKRPRISIQTRLKESTLVHISYKRSHTKALESLAYDSTGYWFTNEWNEPWGKVMKWQDTHRDPDRVLRERVKYEFFLPNVRSKAALRDRLEKLLTWVDTNLVESS